MGDTDDSLSSIVFAEIFQKLLLSLHVECAGRLIKQQDRTLSQEGTSNCDTLSLTFAKTCSKLATNSIKPVRTIHHEACTSRLERFPHVLLGCIRIAEQQVVANGSAKECIALRHINEVAAGSGRNLFRLRLVVHLNCSLRRLEQSKNETNEGSLSCTCLSKDSCGGTFWEIAREMGKNGSSSFPIVETDICETHTCPALESYRVLIILERHLLEFHETFACGKRTDQYGDEARHIAERTLYLADKLYEGDHHAISDDARLQTIDAPKECDKIARTETNA